MNLKALLAVFKRNFVSYFTNPTGYVFICLFVAASSIAAFWPESFFNNNLANLDQLNQNPYLNFFTIMLFFAPAIAMGIWADERRQGTDELLLTIPASDFDVVLGKYLAAVGIYSVALAFSLVCNFAVLRWLGNPDVGLFLATYVGYWLVGLAMLAVGMVASFLTGNLTVAFILGVLFNLPLVVSLWTVVFIVPASIVGAFRRLFGLSLGDSSTSAMSIFQYAGSKTADWSRVVEQFLIPEQFRDFGRGIISLSGVAYFLLIVAVMLYLSMVLIGRRHWRTGWQQRGIAAHFGTRAAAMAVIGLCVVILLGRWPLRADVTSEQLSRLSDQTRELVANLDAKRPVKIEAFVSPEVPESYVQARLDLLNTLRELEAMSRGKVRVTVYDTRPFSEQASLADKRYGIEPREVFTQQQGVASKDQIFMGVALTCGLEKVTVPFVDRGIPVEYELVRSIATVAQEKRKRLGVVRTDAQLYGQFNFQAMSPATNWPIIDELEKQYDVVQVDPSQPITGDYDVLLAVQPSSLGPEEMDNFIAAVESGRPTAIFEDPFPAFSGQVPPSSQPRRPPGGMNPMMMMGGGEAPPKGDIDRLWNILGVSFAPDQIVWQDYNPYLRTRDYFPSEFVFVDKGAGVQEPFSPDDKISSKLQQVLFPFPGAFQKLNTSDLKFTPLATTGTKTGTVKFGEMINMSPFGQGGGLNPERRQVPTNSSYVLAAHIQGTIKRPQSMADDSPATDAGAATDAAPAAEGAAAPAETPAAGAEATPGAETAAETPAGEPEASPTEAKPAEKKPAEVKLNVVLVADLDMLTQDFFRLREQGSSSDPDSIDFQFDNVTFVLNTLDSLAGDTRFLDIRSRRPQHRTLTRIEQRTEKARKEAIAAREKFYADYDEAQKREQKALDDKIDELQNRKDADPRQLLIEVAMQRDVGQRRLDTKLEQLRKERDQKVNKIDTELNMKVQGVQAAYQLWAVLLPPILPLLLAAGVWITRRVQEKQGVPKRRLR